MESLITNTELDLLNKLILNEDAAKRISLIIISIEQFELVEGDSIPKFKYEDYITISSLEIKIRFILQGLLPNVEYEDIIEDNIKSLEKGVFETIENSGFMLISFDENHFPEIEYNDLMLMAKLCITYHYWLFDEEKLLNGNLDSINIIDIENYINTFIAEFTSFEEKMFHKPTVKSSTVLKVAQLIEDSNLLDVDFNKYW